MEKIQITKVGGKFLINGKPYNETDRDEKAFFDEFILAMKWEKQMQDHDKQKKQS